MNTVMFEQPGPFGSHGLQGRRICGTAKALIFGQRGWVTEIDVHCDRCGVGTE
jgi:hypothetical protein